MVALLEADGRVTEAGRAAFAARKSARSRTYSYEQKDVRFDETRLRTFKQDRGAWAFFEAQAPGHLVGHERQAR